jgi:plastocyanin
VSKGKETLHQLSVARITSNVPISTIVKDLGSNGPPPSYVDPTSSYETSTLDSGKSQNTQLILTKPGTYVFFCHLHDRDGGKPHFAKGLITTVTVQ